MKVLILLISLNLFAQFDLSLGTSARSFPAVGAEVFVDSGYNQVLWGKGDKKNPLYGLIRPALTVASSVVVNNYDARIEFYPISFIGLVRGYKHINSKFEDFPFFDCENVRCMGDIKRDYTRAKIGIGAKGIIALWEGTLSNNSYSGDDPRPVAEFRFATLAAPQSDSMYQSRYVLGIKHSSGIFGIVSDYVKFNKSKQTRNMDLFIYTHKSSRTLYTYGIGQFSSTHWAKGVIAVFRMKTNFLDGKTLF